MKKFFLVLLGAMMVSALNAQVIEQGEGALVYYSPKTSVTVDFTYTVETHETGVYAKWAEAMIGAKEIERENTTICTLTDVRIGTATTADYSRPHKVAAEVNVPLLLNINEKGLLVGYNLPYEPKEKVAPRKSENRDGGQKNRGNKVPPFPEEVLKAATPMAQAHAVAQQIFHIRETRMYLLSGEVEHAPADGKAMELVLAELDRQERQLTELFVGKKTVRTEHKHFRIEPESQLKQEHYWFFSEENGFTHAENIDADTITLRLTLHPQEFANNASNGKDAKKKKGAEMSQIVYNLPGSGDAEVIFNGHSLAQRTIPMAQLGIDVPVSKDVFTGAELPVIVFSEKTGNIVSISK
ncbi:MAG: DUF4831 family protein [Paludibacteraceae bacterium]|nr:DUF4831 family protein [Paludibacteraceae bacterium]